MDETSNNDYDERSEIDSWRKGMVLVVGLINAYYYTYIYKEPCYTSLQTGMSWVAEVVNGHHIRCINVFRMTKETMLQLRLDLCSHYGLKSSKSIPSLEKLAIFLYTVGLGASIRQTAERFQRSTETIHRAFYDVLNSTCALAKDLIKPIDSEFKNIPPQILHDKRYMPHFKDCIGAIDGTHIHATIAEEHQQRFRGIKGITTQNVMAACSFDMQFTFILAGWEGSAHHARIFDYALQNPHVNFPKPPPGKYYLVDASYPTRDGYLKPYKETRYHLPEFRRGGQPSGKEEIFNRAHSSLRGCIERTFGVYKSRLKILGNMPCFPYETQCRIVVAIAAIHNYIRRGGIGDPAFNWMDERPDVIPSVDNTIPSDEDAYGSSSSSNASRICRLRDEIAVSLMANRI